MSLRLADLARLDDLRMARGVPLNFPAAVIPEPVGRVLPGEPFDLVHVALDQRAGREFFAG